MPPFLFLAGFGYKLTPGRGFAGLFFLWTRQLRRQLDAERG
jgi:hypothetical protein